MQASNMQPFQHWLGNGTRWQSRSSHRRPAHSGWPPWMLIICCTLWMLVAAAAGIDDNPYACTVQIDDARFSVWGGNVGPQVASALGVEPTSECAAVAAGWILSRVTAAVGTVELTFPMFPEESQITEVVIGEHPVAAIIASDARSAAAGLDWALPATPQSVTALYEQLGFVVSTGAKLRDGHWPDVSCSGAGCPPRIALAVCTAVDAESDGGGTLRHFVAGAAAAGAGAVFVYDIGAESGIADWWRALDGLDTLLSGTRVAVIRAPPRARSPVASYRMCSRAHAAFTDWVIYLDVRERLRLDVLNPGSAAAVLLLRNASVDAIVLASTGACSGGNSGAPYGSPSMRVLTRPLRSAVTSAALPCARDSARVVDGWGASLPWRAVAACNCARDGRVSDCGEHAASGGRINSATTVPITVCSAARTPQQHARSTPAAAESLHESVLSLPCRNAAVSVQCDVPRVGWMVPHPPLPVRGVLASGWTVARRGRAARFAYATMVFGANVEWTLSRLVFTVASLRGVGAVAPIFVFVPDANWVAAGEAFIPAHDGVKFVVSNYVPAPTKCVQARSNSDTTAYSSYKYYAATYTQFSVMLLARFDAVVYIDGLDVHVRAPLERALRDFEVGPMAFAAAPEWGRACTSPSGTAVGTGPFNGGVMFVRPSRALYHGVSRYGDAHPGDTLCALANQDVLNEALPALLGTSRIGCLGPDVHYMPAFARASTESAYGPAAAPGPPAVTHFLGPIKPWLPDPPNAPTLLLESLQTYRAAYDAWGATAYTTTTGAERKVL